MDIERLLVDYESKNMSRQDFVNSLKKLPYEDLEFAKLDHHRFLRRGFTESIYCPGKSKEQINKICLAMIEAGSNFIATKASNEIYDFLRKSISTIRYDETSKLIYYEAKPIERVGSVLIMSGGTSDMNIAEEAALTAELMGNNVTRLYDIGVAGINRLFSNLDQIESCNVAVVVAGMDGALGPVVSGITEKPIIAVPTSVGYGANFSGLSPLLSFLNSCSPGISVVNIDNGFGAGYFASMINKLGNNNE